MKTTTILLFALILNACGNAKATSNETEQTNSQSKIEQNEITIKYRAHTRGVLKIIILDNKTVSIQDSFEVKPTVKPCNNEDWSQLMEMVSAFNLKSMSTLEAPSKAFQYDGAAIANFTITKDGETFDVPSFDAGNPNQEIKALVEMVINIGDKSKD